MDWPRGKRVGKYYIGVQRKIGRWDVGAIYIRNYKNNNDLITNFMDILKAKKLYRSLNTIKKIEIYTRKKIK